MALARLPPGPAHLTRLFLSSFPPSVAVYILVRELVKRTNLGISNALVVIAAILAKPSYVALSSILRDLAIWADAKRKGAIMAPHVYDPIPGGYGIVKKMVASFKSGYPGDIFLEWCKQYGNTYSLRVMGERRVFTFEPDHVKAILATQFDTFDKGPVLEDQLTSLLGTGVFNADGDMWKFHRTMTRPFFTKDRISHFDIFDRHAEDALAQAKQRLAEGYLIDFQDLVSRFTLDSATEFLCGLDVHSLSAGLPYPPSASVPSSNAAAEKHPSDKFVSAFIAGQTLTGLRTRYGPAWRLMEFWRDRVQGPREVVDEFVEPIIDEVLKRRNAKAGGEKEEAEEGRAETLLDSLVAQTQDRQMLKDELVNLLVAGRDTTAATLTFAIYMLTQHPHITKRLREEIATIVGMTGRPTYDQIKEMKYLRAFINETLRLYPPVPFDSRTSNKATVWPSKVPGQQGIYIPAHTKCTYGVFLMHRRTDLWGPDALEFDPDRFLDDRLHKYLTPNPFIFLPFNAGPRICLGQQFAYNESSFFLIRLLQNFSHFEMDQPLDVRPPKEWSACEGSKGREKVLLGTHLTMYVRGGLWVKMGKAADE